MGKAVGRIGVIIPSTRSGGSGFAFGPLVDSLNGFDMVFAATQRAINKQFKTLYDLSILPSTWTVSGNPAFPKARPYIDATLGAPSFAFDTADPTGRRVDVTFPIVDGTFAYNDLVIGPDGNQSMVAKTVALAGSRLTLHVNLNLTGITVQQANGSPVVPPSVKAQLTKFSADDLDLQHLYMDFEDADLVQTADLTPAPGQAVDTTTMPYIEAFQAMLTGLFAKTRGTDNPYILGYVVKEKSGAAPDPATFNPTGVTFSGFTAESSATAGRNALNYLMVTTDRDVPGPPFGAFLQNWVRADDVEGAFVLSAALVFGRHLLPQLASSYGITNAWTRTATGWTVDKANEFNLTSTYTVTPRVGTKCVDIGVLINWTKQVDDKAGSDIGYVDGTASWTTTLSYDFAADGGLSVSSTSPAQPDVTSNSHPNTLGKFEKVIAVIFDGVIHGLVSGSIGPVFTMMTAVDWVQSMQVTLGTAVSLTQGRIIMPAGDVLFFKNATFTDGGHLSMDATYKD